MICLHVDDIMIFKTHLKLINITEMLLTTHFDMKDLRKANVILDKRITWTSDGIFLDQT